MKQSLYSAWVGIKRDSANAKEFALIVRMFSLHNLGAPSSMDKHQLLENIDYLISLYMGEGK